MISYWAGKHLSDAEELTLRRTIALLDRIGAGGSARAAELREELKRFLPENDHKWTPDELEFGAHHGPWLEFEADVEVE